MIEQLEEIKDAGYTFAKNSKYARIFGMNRTCLASLMTLKNEYDIRLVVLENKVLESRRKENKLKHIITSDQDSFHRLKSKYDALKVNFEELEVEVDNFKILISEKDEEISKLLAEIDKLKNSSFFSRLKGKKG